MKHLEVFCIRARTHGGRQFVDFDEMVGSPKRASVVANDGSFLPGISAWFFIACFADALEKPLGKYMGHGLHGWDTDFV